MNWLVFHIVSGQAFFTGILLLNAAALASTRPQRIDQRITVFAFVIGVIGVVISSTPIPFWILAVTGIPTVLWIATRYRKNWRRRAAGAMAAAWWLAACMEIPYHITPTMAPARARTMTVIGDSVTAGIGSDETAETWPAILAREHQLQVQDISHVGETTSSALKRAEPLELTGSVVIVEIGGNDLLGSTSPAQFDSDLNALLAHLIAADRQIVMFELPLPPFCHEFGRVQRAAAARYNVRLVPKRVFLSVIAGSDSTLDSIHLSQSGHQFMADCVWRLVRPAFATQHPDSGSP